MNFDGAPYFDARIFDFVTGRFLGGFLCWRGGKKQGVR